MFERTQRSRGSCPGAHTPMASGDGLLIRVRTSARSLQASELRALCAIAREEGSGLLELTRRANVQLRGLTDASVSRAQAKLVALGLAQARPELEARLVLVTSAWLDDGAAEPLLDTLARVPLSSPLAVKFGITLDDERALLAEVDADLRFERAGEWVEVSAGGTRASALTLGRVAPHELDACLARLLLEITSKGDGRARSLLRANPAALHRTAALAPVEPSEAALGAADRLAPTARTTLGPGFGHFGVGVPFGSASAEQFETLADLAERFGRGRLRITHERSVLLCDVSTGLTELQAAAERAGFFCAAGDPRARLVACPGAPACSSAHGETRKLALSLASRLPETATLHVSGCPKGCAHSGAASFTVVHDADGTRLGNDCDVTQAARLPPLAAGELARIFPESLRP